MNRFTAKAALQALLAATILCLASACATDIRAGATQNPSPEVTFNQFGRFELQSVKLAPRYANQSGNEAARAKIQKELELRLQPMFANWARRDGATLVIEPVIDEVKFINGAARFWVGPIAGSSAVVMSVTFRDKRTGNVIARPQFYQQANAWGGSFTFGVTDNLMLNRIAELAAQYTAANYAQAVGGPTGADDQHVGPTPP